MTENINSVGVKPNEINQIDNEIREIEDQIKQLKERHQMLLLKREAISDKLILENSLKCNAETRWEEETFSWSQEARNVLLNTFHLNEYRPQQLKTINVIMSGMDALLVAPTGGGKSLCYQLPALLTKKGFTLVVSPLISLMEDQVWTLHKLNIPAEYISTENSAKILKLLKSDKCDLKLLYVTPERLAKKKTLMAVLQKCYENNLLQRIAIDEVHCCSQWGHDFRPDYKFLGSLKHLFANISIVGFTATATSRVLMDIQKMLKIKNCIILKAPFNRPNLYYHVMRKPTVKMEAYRMLENLIKVRYFNKSGIIYTFSVSDSVYIADMLTNHHIKASPYHARLNPDIRTRIHSKWLAGEIQVVVATTAFGMGIDKANVRFVIHYTISKSMENYYQESGRAGRDGLYAECILLYRFGDCAKITTISFAEHNGLTNAYNIIKYANGTRCRRDLIAEHFTELWDDSNCNRMCDMCYNKNDENTPIKIDIKKYCEQLYKILDCANTKSIKLTGLQLIDAWYCKTLPDLISRNSMQPPFERYVAEQIVIKLIMENYLKEVLFYTDFNVISYLDKGINQLNTNLKIDFYSAKCFKLPRDSPKIKHTLNDESIILDIKNKKEKYQNKRSRSNEKKKQNYDALNDDDDDHSQSKKKRSHSNSNSSTSKYLKSKDNNIGQSSPIKSFDNNCIDSNKNNHNLLSNESLNESVNDDLQRKKNNITPNPNSTACKSLKCKNNDNVQSSATNLIEIVENTCIDSNRNECDKEIFDLSNETVDNINSNDGDSNHFVIDDDLILITKNPIIIEID